MSEHIPQKPKRGKKIALIIVACVLTLLLIALAAAAIIWNSLVGRINRHNGPVEIMSQEEQDSIRNETDKIDPDFTGPIMNSTDTDLDDKPTELITQGDNIVNILLVGQDRLPGQGRQRSDAMILCTLNKKEKTLTMTSFMRDTWVRIPGYYDERLNVPYAVAGFDLLNQTLEYNFGVKADHVIEVDFSGFENVVNIIGGLDINLTSAEAYHLNKIFNWNLSAGINHLNGKQTLEYARIRAIDNDFNRTSRQRKVLNLVFEKMKGLSVTELYKFAENILPLITTDMTDGEILKYVLEIAPVISGLTVVSQRIPMDGAYADAYIDQKCVLYISQENFEKNKQLLQSSIGTE